VTPRLPARAMVTTPFIEMTSGYVERSRDALPLQGDRAPWRMRQHYGKDAKMYRGAVNDEGLEFRR
jgi:monooxygenase